METTGASSPDGAQPPQRVPGEKGGPRAGEVPAAASGESSHVGLARAPKGNTGGTGGPCMCQTQGAFHVSCCGRSVRPLALSPEPSPGRGPITIPPGSRAAGFRDRLLTHSVESGLCLQRIEAAWNTAGGEKARAREKGRGSVSTALPGGAQEDRSDAVPVRSIRIQVVYESPEPSSERYGGSRHGRTV